MSDANNVIALRLGLPELPIVNWPDEDEITAADRTWVSAHHQEPALLHTVDPWRGLTDADFDAISSWLAEL